jgi:hypothetical protein
MRRGRDSNPRYKFKLVQRFSKPALSATQAPLRLAYAIRRAAKIGLIMVQTKQKEMVRWSPSDHIYFDVSIF